MLGQTHCPLTTTGGQQVPVRRLQHCPGRQAPLLPGMATMPSPMAARIDLVPSIGPRRFPAATAVPTEFMAGANTNAVPPTTTALGSTPGQLLAIMGSNSLYSIKGAQV